MFWFGLPWCPKSKKATCCQVTIAYVFSFSWDLSILVSAVNSFTMLLFRRSRHLIDLVALMCCCCNFVCVLGYLGSKWPQLLAVEVAFSPGTSHGVSTHFPVVFEFCWSGHLTVWGWMISIFLAIWMMIGSRWALGPKLSQVSNSLLHPFWCQRSMKVVWVLFEVMFVLD